MTPYHQNLIADAIGSHFQPLPTYTVSQFCEGNLVFDEPENRGSYSLAGREYGREILDSFADPTITDSVFVSGSQIGKTVIFMGGVAYIVKHEPSRVIWAMPSETLAQGFSETRWLPMLKKSKAMSDLLPTGAERHDVKKLQQRIGSSIVNFFGSNSPANLSSNPARVIVMDEVDKFNTGTNGEADAVNLAEQRAKDQANPKRFKTSTPTLTDGLVWQALLKTDFRRRFVPCPGCQKFVVLVWSKEHTVLKLTGDEAFVKWDKEAKRADGTWDLDRVEKSARYECPHCGFHILDGHKTKMDRDGKWVPTLKAARGHAGWHMPSMYAPSAQTTAGKLAVKFLQDKFSLNGIRGFVNSELAEPWENQENRGERVEIIHQGDDRMAEAISLMTVDVQMVAPYFWVVVRDWGIGPSRLVDALHVDTWEEVREIQVKHGVSDMRVFIDSGDNAGTVYDNCLRWGKLGRSGNGLPVWVGWTPCKGRELEARWIDPETKQPRPFMVGSAALPHKSFQLPLLEFNGDMLKDVLATMRKTSKPFAWELNSKADDEYFRHIDAEVKKPISVGKTGKVTWQWRKRSDRWPNHLLDCEIMQMAAALLKRRITWATHTDDKGDKKA